MIKTNQAITIHKVGNGGFVVTPTDRGLEVTEPDYMVVFGEMESHSYSVLGLIEWLKQHFSAISNNLDSVTDLTVELNDDA